MKITFDQAIDRIIDGRKVDASNVLASALKRKVWIAEWHLPGCISESWTFCTSKSQAINDALGYADTDNGPPRGMKTALARYGRFDSDSPIFGRCINTVRQEKLIDIL